MQDIELAERNAPGAHFFHRALIFTAPGVGEGGIVEHQALWLEQGLGLTGN
jgi:hypothetical protein